MLPDNLTVRIDAGGDCWLWTGSLSKKGYGRLAGKYAHRLVWESLVGPLNGSHLDHRCLNKPCVNPDHLEPVTPRENWRRGQAPTARNLRKKTCLNGHALVGDNVYRIDRRGSTERHCRTCRRDWTRQKRRAA